MHDYRINSYIMQNAITNISTSPSLEGFFFVISLPPVIPTTVGIIQAAIIGVFVGMEVNLYLLNGAVVSQELRIE